MGPLVLAPILIVEDDPGIRSFIVEALHDEGLGVAAVANGPDAIVWLRGRRPALVILDLEVPKVPGEGVLRELLALYHGEVPVVTMAVLPRNVEATRERGARTHLLKPFMLDDMLRAVHAYL
jgi:DNA-binding response OmpR family regulator